MKTLTFLTVFGTFFFFYQPIIGQQTKEIRVYYEDVTPVRVKPDYKAQLESWDKISKHYDVQYENQLQLQKAQEQNSFQDKIDNYKKVSALFDGFTLNSIPNGWYTCVLGYQENNNWISLLNKKKVSVINNSISEILNTEGQKNFPSGFIQKTITDGIAVVVDKESFTEYKVFFYELVGTQSNATRDENTPSINSNTLTKTTEKTFVRFRESPYFYKKDDCPVPRRNPVEVQTKITPSISNNYSLNAFLDIENIKFTQKEEAIYMYIYFDITNRYNIDYDCSEMKNRAVVTLKYEDNTTETITDDAVYPKLKGYEKKSFFVHVPIKDKKISDVKIILEHTF